MIERTSSETLRRSEQFAVFTSSPFQMGATAMQRYPRADSQFFVIDSESLAETESRLYGFSLRRGGAVESIEQLGDGIPDGNGAYILVKRRADRIEIHQDFIGSHGLYVFRDGSYFALSNSFARLVDHVKRKHRITLNLDVARMLLGTDLCLTALSGTLAKEIEMLDRSATVSINIAAKTLKVGSIDHEESTVDLDSPEGLRLLDCWYQRWTGRIRSLDRQGRAMSADLSGGFDTRMVLALLLGSRIDASRMFVHSIQGETHCFKEDYAIACQISSRFGFKLNGRRSGSTWSAPMQAKEILDASYLCKLGFHKQMYFRQHFVDSRYSLSGNGGECVRGYPEKDLGGHLKSVLYATRFLPASALPVFAESIRSVFDDALDRVAGKFARLGRTFDSPALASHLYRDTRCRHHYGKSVVESFSGGQVVCCPLLDPDLHRIKTRTSACEDPRLLMTVLLMRFRPELLEFPVEGGRSFAPATLEAAYSINSSHPRPSALMDPDPGMDDEVREEPSNRQVATDLPVVSRETIDTMVLDALRSPQVRDDFQSVFGEAMYQHLVADTQTRTYFPLEAAHAALAICKVLRTSSVGSDSLPETPADFIAGCIGRA